MEDSPSLLGTVLSWLCAAVWILILCVVFTPLLATGYIVRGFGTVLCNAAYALQEFMAYLGRKVNE